MTKRIVHIAGLVVATFVAVLAVTGCGSSGTSKPPPRRMATQEAYDAIKADMGEQRIDIQFLLLHARLNTPAELSQQLGRLADASREQEAVLAAIDPPTSIALLVGTLHSAVAAQTATLRQVARASRSEGPPAARAAAARLLRQSARIVAARQRLENSFLIGF
ncbi:hypothetical protein [Conexibacter sp. CPCC 206217]|uniref:hypothetical protein n=1 Tax=Conexibacter sp. CPCC 206217 TaxID=3064574 RepID=UPI00271E8834|nr:hypothetical protein [Conexibacter sp. CPCC 206217]MDO8210850.1 hypothetical protein [Conexibacter sp. CPCC 206217]